MNKYVKYDKNASALELARVFKRAQKGRLKMIYEVKFIYGQELLKLHELIQQKTREIEYMAACAQSDREAELLAEHHLSIN